MNFIFDRDTVKLCKFKSTSPMNGFTDPIQCEKHKSDRGIYTIIMHKKENTNSPPIKLKRPTLSTTVNSNQLFVNFSFSKKNFVINF